MKRIAWASLIVLAFGCGEPKGPPPGAGKVEELQVEIPDTAAPKDDEAAPTNTSTEKDSSDGEPQEK